MKIPSETIENIIEELKTQTIPVMAGVNCSIETHRYKLLNILKDYTKKHNDDLPDPLEIPASVPDVSIVRAYSHLRVPFCIQTDETRNTKCISLVENIF